VIFHTRARARAHTHTHTHTHTRARARARARLYQINQQKLFNFMRSNYFKFVAKIRNLHTLRVLRALAHTFP